MPEPITAQRADKYLHHVRIFKTRSLAVQACDNGQVKIDDKAIKPSRDVRAGDTLHVERGDLRLVVKVIALSPVRIGAPLVPQFYENLTPQENYIRANEARLAREASAQHRTEPMTKKDMRLIRQWMGKD